LVALALMRHASMVSVSTGAQVIAIEEPEAHLHPSAIHELRDVLVSLSNKSQVIVASHSPLFVNPADLESTIIVKANRAVSAQSIAEVRDVLGVRLSDNLQSAKIVAVFEGSDDIIIMKEFLRHFFPELKSAILKGDIVFDDLGGASNLSYKIRTYRSSASLVQCFLDNDSAGTTAVDKAVRDHVLKVADYNIFVVNHLAESELEDLLNAYVYKDDFFEEFGVDPTIKPKSLKGKKWSDAMAIRFAVHGKKWDEIQKARAKFWLANYVARTMPQIILEERRGPADAFAASLIRKLTPPSPNRP
jgi:putative ATP-dependent endonuclease of the OLD family